MKKLYAGGGAIVIIKDQDTAKEYIVLTRRSDDAPCNPGVHSGFFGGVFDEADEGEGNLRELEQKYSRYATYRELLEELLTINMKKVLGIVTPNVDTKKVKDPIFYIKELFQAWVDQYPNSIKVEDPELIPLNNAKEVKLLDYEEFNRERSLVRINISVLKTIRPLGKDILLDGERDDKTRELKNREIDVFNLKEFKEWFSNRKNQIFAKFSFKTGRRTRQNVLKNISPSLKNALLNWWYPSKYSIKEKLKLKNK